MRVWNAHQLVQEIREYFVKEEMNQEETNIKLEEMANHAPIVKTVNTMLSAGFFKGASDIHIEPTKEELCIRFRINGDLILHTSIPITAHPSIVTRLKLMGGMNIAEKRLPQDGKFQYLYEGQEMDVRVSSLPTIFGEKMVLRLLGGREQEALMDIRNLGMTETQREEWEHILKAPYGLILVSGPTGSGKTTTLYSALNQMVQKPVHIVTVEDPVEKVMEGITQVQVNPKIGLTFQTALRAILRQDPDVIMIGEIRDMETATIGVRAAITGHLVLATLHTNDCASTVMRLIDMGVAPYLLSASLTGVVAQRLVKCLCPHCKQEYMPSKQEQNVLGRHYVEGKKLWKAVGCAKCNQTGYQGRIAVYEMIQVDEKMGEMIANGPSVQELRAYEREKRTLLLRDSAVLLVLEGKTSIEELEKLIYFMDEKIQEV